MSTFSVGTKVDLTDPATLVWPSTVVPILNFSGLTTRGLLDAAVMLAAVLLVLIGVFLITKPDIGRLVSKLGPLAAVAAA